jgi:nicotinate-nucleotide adenylyltransferase
MNLTVFSGTFNPVHTAHLIIAETVRAELDLKKILFIPAYNPPHRNISLALPEHRLNMVKLAIESNQYFEVSDIEYNLGGKSYSYLTIKKLYEIYPDLTGKINFIIGTDAFKLIDSWYEAEKLAEIVNFIIINRIETLDIDEMVNSLRLKNFDYKIVKVPLIELSSTYIRNNLKENKSIKYLVPDNVEKYILENNLYNKIR